MNEADSAKIAAMLQEVGYRSTDDEEEADIVVLTRASFGRPPRTRCRQAQLLIGLKRGVRRCRWC
jgi:tRNA A37 methylthiotransferase MiaB